MKILEKIHQPPPSCSDNVITENIDDPSARKKLVLIFVMRRFTIAMKIRDGSGQKNVR